MIDIGPLWWCKVHHNAVEKEWHDWDTPDVRPFYEDDLPYECALVAGDREGIHFDRKDCDWIPITITRLAVEELA